FRPQREGIGSDSVCLSATSTCRSSVYSTLSAKAEEGGMSGRVGDLSPKQAEALEQFREKIQDVLPQCPYQSDHYLLRWLRARNFNVQKSEAMLRKHLEFRKNMKVDTLLTDWKPPEVLEKYVPGGFCGFDRDGNPVGYDFIGPVDMKGILLSASKQDFIKYKIRECEMLQKIYESQSKRLGKNVESMTTIYDCEGLAMKHFWKPGLDLYGELMTVVEDNYPEGLKRFFALNAPKLFSVIYNMLKPFVSEETRNKVIVLGSNWQEVLRQYIDPDELPAIYGGNLTDPDGDPRCRTKIKQGGQVPQSYYAREFLKVQYDQCVSISRGSSHQLEYEILAPGCVLRWQFCSEGADVGFGVFIKKKLGQWMKAGQMQEVVPSQRYNAHLVPEDGSITCTEPGVSEVEEGGMSGRVGDLSPKQAEALAQHLEFRKNMKVDTLLTDWKPPEVLEKYVPGGFCGFDRDGNPVGYDFISPVDMRGILLSASKQDFIKYKIRECEMLQKIYESQSKRFMALVEDNYPEGLKRFFVLKAPKLFSVLYNLLKPFVSEETRNKVMILGSNWQEVLRQYIDPDELPAIYGGNLTDPDGDPRCRTKINQGGQVPQSYYAREFLKVQYDHSVSISRGSSHQLEYEILAPGCVLRWQFCSEGGDVGFGVFIKKKLGQWMKAGQMQEVVSSQRYNAHLVPEDGSITCTEPGVYVIRFDNTYSVLQSKKVRFSVDVLLPSSDSPLSQPEASSGSEQETPSSQ
ncbi:hypothetical protein NFI96_011117, partial [Prochilodus magdalenae]